MTNKFPRYIAFGNWNCRSQGSIKTVSYHCLLNGIGLDLISHVGKKA